MIETGSLANVLALRNQVSPRPEASQARPAARLAQEIRDRLIEGCSITGGHIGASLGVVELTIALLYEFESPIDKIVWDVGHQAYAWKLLTGRNDQFTSLRQRDGISGFLKRSESQHDQLVPVTRAPPCRLRSA